MIQMLKNMLHAQQLAAASGKTPKSAGNLKKQGTAIKPSDVIALDDDDFGNF
jgi:hypothetical protein